MNIAPAAVFGQILVGGTDRIALNLHVDDIAPQDHLVLRVTTQKIADGQIKTVDEQLYTGAQPAGSHYIIIDSTFYDYMDLVTVPYFNAEANLSRQNGSPARLIAVELLNNGQVIDTVGDPSGTTPLLPNNSMMVRNGYFFAAPGSYVADDYTVTPAANFGQFDQYTVTLPSGGTEPSVMAMHVVGDGHGTSDSATFEVIFNQPVHGVTTSSFEMVHILGGTGKVSGVETTDFVTWKVQVTEITGVGPHFLELANGMSGITGTYAVPLSDQSPFAAPYFLDAAALVFDTVSATTTGHVEGWLNAGDKVEFHLSTSTAATPSADADVTMTLSNGVVLHATPESLHAGTTQLVFEYVVGSQGGEAGAEDIASLAIQSVTLAQGTLDDGAGNAATFVISTQPLLEFSIDTTPPALKLVAVTDLENQAFEPGQALRADETLRFEMRAEEPLQIHDGMLLELSNGAKAMIIGTSDNARSIFFDYTVRPGDDTTSLSILGFQPPYAVTDRAGNLLSPVVEGATGLSVDTVAPPVTISGVTPDFGADPHDGITFAGLPLLLSGTVEPGSTVTVWKVSGIGTQMLGTASTNDGTWTFDLGTTLNAGFHEILVNATDTAGNSGFASLPLTLALPATVPTVLGVGLHPMNIGNATNSAAPNIYGVALPGSTVTVMIDGVPAGTALVNENGAWSLPTSMLADGQHLLVAEARGVAGDLTPPVPFTFAVDAHGPAVTDVTVVSTTGQHGNLLLPGDSAQLAVTFDEPVSLTGTLMLQLSNGALLASSGLGADGKSVLFDYVVQPGQGDAVLEAVFISAIPGSTLTDQLGNDAALILQPNSLGLSVHTILPKAPTLALADAEGNAIPAAISATGALAAGLHGDGSILEYAVDGGAFSTAVPAFAHDGSQDGQHVVSVRAVDAYGLVSEATALTFTLDTIAPPVALTDLSLVASAGKDHIRLGGTLETVPGTTVHVFDAETDLGAATLDGLGGWSFGTTLATGSHALRAVAVDAAGNIGDTPRLASISGDTVTLPFKLGEGPVSHDGSMVKLNIEGVNVSLKGVGHFQFADGMVDQDDGAAGVDDLYYFLHNPDVWAAHLDPDQHYQQFGWKEGRDPNAYFSTSGYLAANPDVAASGADPLSHYEQIGWKEGRDASINFDTTRYLAANPDVVASGMDPLTHFLTYGQAEGRSAFNMISREGFDAGYYLATNPDVAASGMDAWAHFTQFGASEGRNPNVLFDTTAYLTANPDVAASGLDPLSHYNQFGWLEGRNPGAGFDTAYYEAAYADVAAANINPLVHYLEHGIFEGRMPLPDYGLIT